MEWSFEGPIAAAAGERGRAGVMRRRSSWRSLALGGGIVSSRRGRAEDRRIRTSSTSHDVGQVRKLRYVPDGAAFGSWRRRTSIRTSARTSLRPQRTRTIIEVPKHWTTPRVERGASVLRERSRGAGRRGPDLGVSRASFPVDRAFMTRALWRAPCGARARLERTAQPAPENVPALQSSALSSRRRAGRVRLKLPSAGAHNARRSHGGSSPPGDTAMAFAIPPTSTARWDLPRRIWAINFLRRPQ